MTFTQLSIQKQISFLHLLANILALTERNPEAARKAIRAATGQGTATDPKSGWGN